ncbi:MAG: hypothetical protein NZ480_03270, partial [Bdellovibrionaceae bacterium]|nr:hypothetical protein [Pseudobdellovibrionaceae bacterium]MDW8189906.1 hypothetical protein [Pseudobdellovibrionaceae bacterium]
MKRFMFMMFLVSGIFLLGCQSQKGGEQKQQRRQVRGNQQNLVIPQRFDDSRYRYLSSVGRIFSDSRYSTE